MKTPPICAGLGKVSQPLAVATFSLLLLSACATRVEWTPKPDPGMLLDLEPAFGAWTDTIKPMGDAVLTSSLPLPERLKLPDGRKFLPTWTGLRDSPPPKQSSVAKSKTAEKGTGYTQVGTASWYGPDFHGKKTANGEIYDQYGLTAAHKTLPFNSVVQVKNLSSGRTVNVRINNRGPFVNGRIIDLSVGAAKALGTYEKGVSKVEIRRIQ